MRTDTAPATVAPFALYLCDAYPWRAGERIAG